jgi:hypothetical protein
MPNVGLPSFRRHLARLGMTLEHKKRSSSAWLRACCCLGRASRRTRFWAARLSSLASTSPGGGRHPSGDVSAYRRFAGILWNVAGISEK